ncbi:MAG: hypothetical protein SGPRY_005834 [Prymnesium sp.]
MDHIQAMSSDELGIMKAGYISAICDAVHQRDKSMSMAELLLRCILTFDGDGVGTLCMPAIDDSGSKQPTYIRWYEEPAELARVLGLLAQAPCGRERSELDTVGSPSITFGAAEISGSTEFTLTARDNVKDQSDNQDTCSGRHPTIYDYLEATTGSLINHIPTPRFGLSSRLGSALRRVARLGQVRAKHSDAELMSSLLRKQLPHHKLEQELGDPDAVEHADSQYAVSPTQRPPYVDAVVLHRLAKPCSFHSTLFMRAARLRRLYFEATTAASSSQGTGITFEGVPLSSMDTAAFYGSVVGRNCENVVGFIPLPLGVVGPLSLDGEEYLIPLATTEGALIASTNRGARAISMAGGAISVLLADGMTRAPLVSCVDLAQAAALKAYCEGEEGEAANKQVFSQTTRYGSLQGVKVALAGRHAYLRFRCSTGDAMGMNMVGKGVNQVVSELLSRFPGCELMALSGNFCTDKKPSAVNWIEGRGKSVAAEAILPGRLVRSVLKADVERLVEVNTNKNLVGSAMAGSLGGFNAHASNIVTALFLACGQDPAQNVESSNCITLMETVPNGEDFDLRVSCTMPSIECGTVGGGTALAAQECSCVAVAEMFPAKMPNA